MIWRDTFGYKLLLLLHLLSVVIGFGPYFLGGLLHRSAAGSDDTSRAVGAGTLQVSTVSQFAIYGVFVFGGALIGASDKKVDFSDWWVPVSVVLWIATVGVLHALVLPAQRRLKAGEGDRAALARQLSTAFGIINLLVVGTLVLMVWEPGGSRL